MKRLDEFKDKAAVTEYLKKEKGFTTAKEVDAYLHETLTEGELLPAQNHGGDSGGVPESLCVESGSRLL